MKKIDCEHFGRFACPYGLRARGDALYFSVRRADFEKNCYTNDLYVLQNAQPRRLTSLGDVGSFCLLEDGVVFPALRDKKDRKDAEKGLPLTVLQKLPYDGGEAQEYLRLDYAAADFRFVGDGKFFFTAAYRHAFAAALEQNGGDREKAAEALKQEEDYRVLDELPFYENGRGYVNKIRDRLYLYDHGAVTPLTDEWTNVSVCCLSSDGERLYYIARRYTDRATLCDRLMELDVATLEARDVSVSDTAAHFRAVPLPDGGLMALAIVSERYGVNENPKAFLRENGGWRLLYGAGGHNFYNSLSSDVIVPAGPDSPQFWRGCPVFSDTQDDSVQLASLDPATAAVTNLTHEKGNITDFIRWKDGFALCALRDGRGTEIYYVNESGVQTRLTGFNDSLSEEYEYFPPQEFTFTNAVGDAVHGWVIAPAGLTPGRKVPAVLDIHGGPKTAYGACYFHEMQLWASKGWAVLFCDPTGSDGRGDGFADIRGAYGRQDYADIMQFTDEALKRFDFLDAQRMGVTGGSYGGFMTNWIIGHTDRFRAAASQRSIANWVSFSGTSDIGGDFDGDQVGASCWDDMQKVWAQSPLKYADRVKTPTLFIHSDEDYRCPLSEGLQMFSALIAHGVPARLCMFKGENHELSRSGKPLHRVRRLQEITRWFEQYL